jgi:hypothetical protein
LGVLYCAQHLRVVVADGNCEWPGMVGQLGGGVGKYVDSGRA